MLTSTKSHLLYKCKVFEFKKNSFVDNYLIQLLGVASRTYMYMFI